MAASLTRPDPSSPSSVADAGFSTARRGYQTDEVRAFLTSVAAELSRVQDRVRALEGELADLRAAGGVTPADLDEETVAALLGEETVRVLQTARESASDIKGRAEESAARILREANEEAKRVRHDADIESARRRQDAASNAEAEIALAKQQGREMVNEARAYRERVLADLDRRTTLARNQIEELLHGRDRLLQVFERARLVAVDVTSELQAVDSPDELVNLAPTTGPVPVMVPNSPPPEAATEPVADAEADDAAESDAAAVVADVEIATDVADAVADADEMAEHDDASDRTDASVVTDDAVDVVESETTDDITDEDVVEVLDEVVEDDTDEDNNEDDTNVVELFRARVDDPDAGSDEHDVADPERDDERTDVGGLFARLRDEVTIDDESPVEDRPAASDGDAPADTAGETAFERRDEALVPLIVTGARKLKRVLADEQNGVLDTLGGKTPVTELDDLVADADAHAKPYVDALREELDAAARVGAAEIDGARTPDASAIEVAEELLRSDLIGPLRDRLQRAIADGAGDNEAVSRTTRSIYREWKTQHIDDQLDDIFRYAHGGGMIAVAEGTQLVWTADPSVGGCADGEDNCLAGPVAAGNTYPTGHTAAPAHPGCRCLTLPAGR